VLNKFAIHAAGPRRGRDCRFIVFALAVMFVIRQFEVSIGNCGVVSFDLIREGLGDFVPTPIVQDVDPAVDGCLRIDASVGVPLICYAVVLRRDGDNNLGPQGIKIDLVSPHGYDKLFDIEIGGVGRLLPRPVLEFLDIHPVDNVRSGHPDVFEIAAVEA